MKTLCNNLHSKFESKIHTLIIIAFLFKLLKFNGPYQKSQVLHANFEWELIKNSKICIILYII